MHLIKKGLQDFRVFMRESNDDLYWITNVGFFELLDAAEISLVNKFLRNSFLQLLTTSTQSALSGFLFLFMNPII